MPFIRQNGFRLAVTVSFKPIAYIKFMSTIDLGISVGTAAPTD